VPRQRPQRSDRLDGLHRDDGNHRCHRRDGRERRQWRIGRDRRERGDRSDRCDDESARRWRAARTALAAVLLAVPAAVSFAAPAGAGAALAHRSYFATPSRNIGCVLVDGTARCDIRARTWAPPPRPGNCPSEVDYGQGIVVSTAGRAMFVCAGDTALIPHAPVLAYGRIDVDDGFYCSSERSGVRCRSAHSGHGFVISRAGYRLF
jgi:hypothetical protein